MVAYDKTQSKMAFFDSSRAHDFVFISGTKVMFGGRLVVIRVSVDFTIVTSLFVGRCGAWLRPGRALRTDSCA